MYIQPELNSWSGRIDDVNDPKSFRYHQVVEMKSVNDELKDANQHISLISFASDEGVRRNAGRVGAAKGPDAIKGALSSIPWRLGNPSLVDVGTVQCEGENLEQAQAFLGEQVTKLLGKGNHTIILGGGHETLYGHYVGVRNAMGSNAKLGIINIDAHFDIRKHDVQPSSGTMFNQILSEDTNTNYMVLGIQEFGNTTELFNRADQFGVHYVLEEALVSMGETALNSMISEFIAKQDAVILTLCMDVIAAPDAPGVSAPSPFGLQPIFVRQLIQQIAKDDKVRSFDICEVNPIYDQDNRTAKLAAQFVNEVVRQFSK
ncbi:formimidoylglutamase [Sporosarcina sp. UB5]|uniref:formimidoylglutamase n=1 Tax=Sporosarcina sp. UB5 TaxID=3047463 RepID=UPI003D79BCF7